MTTGSPKLDHIIKAISEAKSILLTTHKNCDGDGLGAELGLFHSMKTSGKQVQLINPDQAPRKYRFLEPEKHIQFYDIDPSLPDQVDLALVFDTNDYRMIEPLWTQLQKRAKKILFIDHHPSLKKGPLPTAGSWIDTNAASTGEMAFKIMKGLGLTLTREAARAFYTSITFDTQLYRFVRNSPTSHLIAAELLGKDINPDEIHRHLFGNQTVQKLAFLAKTLSQIEYFCQGQLAVLKLNDRDLFHYNMDPDDSRDVIDMLMNIEDLEAAALFREDGNNDYKVSLRSKGRIEILQIAESLGGGGHAHAAGAQVIGAFDDLKNSVIEQVENLLTEEGLLSVS